ncbi:MAG: hypothetical protein VKP72_06805 [bacterium]|nr:hypothetical protein [bacterium]
MQVNSQRNLTGFDSASLNATLAVENASEKVASLVNQMNALIEDLANPEKQAAAQARLQMLQMQISMITNVMNAVKDLMKSFFQR